MAANDKQISGEHYKNRPIEPWDFVAANHLDYFQGSAIKYITRFREKGGRRDLEKAIHFLEKLIEIEYEGEELQNRLERDRIRDSYKVQKMYKEVDDVVG